MLNVKTSNIQFCMQCGWMIECRMLYIEYRGALHLNTQCRMYSASTSECLMMFVEQLNIWMSNVACLALQHFNLQPVSGHSNAKCRMTSGYTFECRMSCGSNTNVDNCTAIGSTFACRLSYVERLSIRKPHIQQYMPCKALAQTSLWFHICLDIIGPLTLITANSKEMSDWLRSLIHYTLRHW